MVTIFISDSIDLGSKVVHKIITAVLLGMPTPVDALFFVNLVTVLNKYRGLVCFLLEEMKSNQI